MYKLVYIYVSRDEKRTLKVRISRGLETVATAQSRVMYVEWKERMKERERPCGVREA